MTPLGLLTLAGLGYGAYYIATRKPTPVDGTCPEGWHYMADGTCMRDEDMQGGAYTPGAAAYDPPGWAELLGTYQACIYGHCSAGDCARLNEYLDTLDAESADEQAWIDARRTEVARSCPAIAIPRLPDVFGIGDRYQTQYDRCFSGQCSFNEVQALAASLSAEALKYALDYPSVTSELYNSVSSLRQQTGVAGVAGAPHVGNCGCESCQAATGHDDDEPCCEACAMGVGACACARDREEEYRPTVRGV